ncbi:MAG: hypothetical protein IKQ40_00485, partial [Lachnospiraceae bacterium]|nr:hypothetical protein [Lachnospiraceae bacterium]
MVKYRKLIGILVAGIAMSVMASPVTVSASESEILLLDELMPDDTEISEDIKITEDMDTAEASEVTEDPELFGLQEDNMPEDVTVPSMVPFSYETNKNLEIIAIGSYVNWDGVTNVAQFKGPDGTLCFAADNDKSVIIYRTDANHHIT